MVKENFLEKTEQELFRLINRTESPYLSQEQILYYLEVLYLIGEKDTADRIATDYSIVLKRFVSAMPGETLIRARLDEFIEAWNEIVGIKKESGDDVSEDAKIARLMQEVKPGDKIVVFDPLNQDYDEHIMLVKSVETERGNVCEGNPTGIVIYGDNLTDDSIKHSIRACYPVNFIGKFEDLKKSETPRQFMVVTSYSWTPMVTKVRGPFGTESEATKALREDFEAGIVSGTAELDKIAGQELKTDNSDNWLWASITVENRKGEKYVTGYTVSELKD